MDEELPKSELPKPFRKSNLRVNKSHLLGNASYKGSVVWQHTLSIDDIAARIVDKQSEYRKKTFITAFNLLKRRIYGAIEEGYNVGFGFGRAELTMNEPFENLYKKFSPNRHTLVPRLRPASELKQQMADLRAVNETYQPDYSSQPRPAYVGLRIQPRTPDSNESYSQLPTGEHHFISTYGDRLKLVSGDPRVDLYLHRPNGPEEHFYPPSEMFINTGGRLCFTPDLAFTDGEWVAEAVT